MADELQDNCGYLTGDLPGVGGALKREPEDFIVDEVPLYPASGEGEHLFLQVRKRDVSSEQLLQHVARTLGIGRGDVGCAGLKDRRAVTTQWLSIPRRCEGKVAELNGESVQLLQAIPHRNKLRTGHLARNRFEIVLRDVGDDALARGQAIARVIDRAGFPNLYGDQRFGREEETLRLGLDLLSGRTTEKSIPPARRKFLLRLALSSVQSWLFNRVLARRMETGLVHTVLPGDVMQVVASGGLFASDDNARDQQRFEQREIVITGPMFGPKMTSPLGQSAELEQSVLTESGLSLDDFRRYSKLLPGTRRALLVWPEGLAVQSEPNGLRLTFTLPPGAYATSLLREFMK